jgi:UDP:flavonoid glycosyltransferase YjiC (YdhE family)
VPQIVLPAWYDLYTLAVRVETLGHGIYANKGYEPTINCQQLTHAIVRVLQDRRGEEGHRIKARCVELARGCLGRRGDKHAGDVIIAAAKKEPLDGWFH